jgi:regulator of protease activity HflC (stomatin/prohibitin superfamily)
MTKVWERDENTLAQRFMKNELGGIFRKHILVRDNESAVIEKEGQIYEKIGSGLHTISSFLDREFTEVVFVDNSIKNVKEKASDIWTKDDKKINAVFEMKFRIYDPKKFIKNLLKTKNIFGTEELWDEIYTELLSKVLIPEIRKRSIDELYGNREFLKSLEASFDIELKKLLNLWGIELISISLLWEFPPEYESFLKERSLVKEKGEIEEIQHKEELKRAMREKELESIKKTSDLEKKVIEKEIEMELERKQMQRDMEEALEAIKLKEIKDKKKILTELERKKLGLKENSDQ